jgi:hypothetical protein
MESHDYPIVHFDRMRRLAVALKALPAHILEHQYSGESFGSWYLVVRHNGRVSQLVYDGRDDHLGLRHSPDRKPPYSYGSAQSVGPGAGLGKLDAAAIEEICRAITS